MRLKSAQSQQVPCDKSRLHEVLVSAGAVCDDHRTFPTPSLQILAEAGFAYRFFDRGWTPETVVELMDALRLVGRADLSVGRLFEGHVNAIHLIAWYGSTDQIAFHRHRVSRGTWYGVWATEIPPGVKLVNGNGSLHLSGSKAFASGSGHLDFAVVTAAADDTSRRIIIVPANDSARADNSHWRVRGMRASVSGRYNLDQLPVSTNMILGEPGCYDREPRFTAGAWRFLAVQLGGIEALVSETRALMTTAAKADPLQREKFALAVEGMRTSFMWVREAALRFAGGDQDAIAITRMARGVVERAALDAMSLCARIVGTRSAFEGERIDKISRDLSLYLRQAHPDQARDLAAQSWLDHDPWESGDRLW